IPPATPSSTRGGTAILLLALGVLEQAGLDLAHGDRERLLARPRLDERADVLEQALAQLRVVVVDLTGALGRVDHERVLGAHLAEEVVDRRGGGALRGGNRNRAGQRGAHSFSCT